MAGIAAARESSKTNRKRAVIYARYSTSKQQAISIDDQIALCRREVERRDPTAVVVELYKDFGKSASSTVGRDEFNKMLRDAEQGKFDVLYIESLDRFARTLADTACFCRDLESYGVKIVALHDGEISTMMIAMKGAMNEELIRVIASKVHRHHEGRAREGKILGLLPYGYRPVKGKPGQREIDPEQAVIVRRIFEQYAAGTSPRGIAEALNNEGIPSSGAGRNRHGMKLPGLWTHTVLVNGNGFLNNRTYIGEITWNRKQNFKKRSGGVGRRDRDPSEWIVTKAPELRIISPALWDATRRVRGQRAAARNNTGHQKVVPRMSGLLSGLLRCSECGGDMRVATGQSGTRTRRIACSSAAKSAQLCEHRRSYDLNKVELESIEFVKGIFARPDRIQQFVNLYQQKSAAKRKQYTQERSGIERRRNEIETSIRRLMRALESGGMPEDILFPKLRELEAERVGLEERLQVADAEIEKLVVLPTAIKQWHTNLSALAARMDEAPPELRMALRNLVDHIKIHPTKSKWPYKIETLLRFSALATASKAPFPKLRSPAEIGQRQGIVLKFDNGQADVSGRPLSNNEKDVISLGVFTTAA